MPRPVSITLTGFPELDQKLSQLQTQAGNRVARNALGAAARVARKSIRSLADRKWFKDSVDMRNEKGRRGKLETKVGINVGKRSKSKGRRWAPVWALGSTQRVRKMIGGKFAFLKDPTESQLSTGQIKPHGIVRQGFASAQGGMASAMKAAFDRSLAREIAKAKLNKG